MLAQGFDKVGTTTQPRAQKVCGPLPWPLLFVAGALLVMDWARATAVAGLPWEHQLSLLANQMTTETATAVHFVGAMDAQGFPVDSAWEIAPPVRFSADWRGQNADPERETEVRLLWTPQTLYLRFDARYRVLTVFPDSDPSGRRDHLWDRDVCETFLQPDPSQLRRYKEIEVAPNGFWIDLDIGAGPRRDLQSGMRRRVDVDSAAKKWRAVLALPMKSLTESFDPAAVWRVNFFRVEGSAEPRFYSSWQATATPQPNFHVPEVFGRLVFAPGAPK
jgi:Carbohydrate-binding family 9